MTEATNQSETQPKYPAPLIERLEATLQTLAAIQELCPQVDPTGVNLLIALELGTIRGNLQAINQHLASLNNLFAAIAQVVRVGPSMPGGVVVPPG